MFQNDQLPAHSRKQVGWKISTLFTLPRPAEAKVAIKQFVVTFVVAAAACGISLSLFIVVLTSLYRQFGGRTLV